MTGKKHFFVTESFFLKSSKFLFSFSFRFMGMKVETFNSGKAQKSIIEKRNKPKRKRKEDMPQGRPSAMIPIRRSIQHVIGNQPYR
jgi:hypothetical protein